MRREIFLSSHIFIKGNENMFNFILIIVYFLKILFFFGTIFLVGALIKSIVNDVRNMYSNAAYIFASIFGAVVFLFYIAIAIASIWQVFSYDIIPLWIKISGAGY